jgi:hypothetical protein
MIPPRLKAFAIAQATGRHVLTILWVASGAAKLFALKTFETILSNHGVLSDRAIDLAWIVPVIELTLGILVFGSRGPRLAHVRRAAAVASTVLLIIFCIYIAQVPADIFRTVGCGCQGAFGLTDLVGSPSRAGAVAINSVFIAASVLLWPSIKPAPASPALTHPQA